MFRVSPPKDGGFPVLDSRRDMASFPKKAPSAGATAELATAVTVEAGQGRPRSTLRHHERGAKSRERVAFDRPLFVGSIGLPLALAGSEPDTSSFPTISASWLGEIARTFAGRYPQ